jgi:hypothetical protein
VCVEITVVSIVITFMRVKITMRVEITLVSVIFTRIHVKITLVYVETTLCMYNHTLIVEIVLSV